MGDKNYYPKSAEELQTLSRDISENIYKFSSSEPYSLHVNDSERMPVDMKDFVDVLQYLDKKYPIDVSHKNPYWVVSCLKDCSRVVKSSMSYLVSHYEVEEIVTNEDTVEVWLYPHCYKEHCSRYMKSALSLYNSETSGTISRQKHNSHIYIHPSGVEDPVPVDPDDTVEELQRKLDRFSSSYEFF